jgi:ABC-type Fe3+-hydroxamate transport system substrate-binding protein
MYKSVTVELSAQSNHEDWWGLNCYRLSPETLKNSLNSVEERLAAAWTQRNYTEEDRYQIRESVNNSYFNYLYMGLANFDKVIKMNTDEATKNTASAYGANCNQIAAAKIMKVWLMDVITDTWGNVPYSDIAQLEDKGVLYCKYDDQKDIYAGMISELDEAVGMIDENQSAFTSGDVIFGGDASKWKKFGNSLKCRPGSIADVGNGMNPDIEKIIDLHPDAIMLSPFENSGGYGRVEKLNIPIIECADYMETSALGRAEWMRFYGLLFGEAQKADSLFAEVEKNYNELKALVAPLSSAPSVISELKNGSAWYVPGGKSTSARIYADAGANYVFADDEHSGSVPLAFETVFDKGQNADFWLIKYNQAIDKTYKELEQDYAPYTGFRAFKERNIYGCNTGKVDFYEDSPFHPDRLLKDLIKIFHPTLLEGYELKYFTKLAE